MVKRLILIAAIALISVMLYGCAAPVTSIDKDDIKENDVEVRLDIDTMESLFILNNSLLAADVVSLLGDPDTKSEPIIWGADGYEHQTWYYNSKGIELGFVKDDENKQNIFSIYLQSPCDLKTSRGISIGSTRDEVLNAYKQDINQEENSIGPSKIVAGSVYGGVIFTLENDKVVAIFIGSAAE